MVSLKTWRKFCIHQGHGTRKYLSLSIHNLIEVLWIFLKSRKSLASGVYKQAPSPTTKHAQIFPKKDFSSLLFCSVVVFLLCQKISHHHYLNPTFSSSHLFIHFSPVYSMLHSSVDLLRAFPVFYSFERYVLSGKQNLQKKINENQSLKNKRHTGDKRKYYVCGYVLCCIEIIVVGFFLLLLLSWGRWTMWLTISLLLDFMLKDESKDEETAKVLND